jgi:hypothetical protein
VLGDRGEGTKGERWDRSAFSRSVNKAPFVMEFPAHLDLGSGFCSELKYEHHGSQALNAEHAKTDLLPGSMYFAV